MRLFLKSVLIPRFASDNNLVIVVKEDLPQNPEAICILGRGIEKVATNRGYMWRPTRYIELPDEHGEHTGHRVRIEPEDAGAWIAGSNANVIAACQVFRECPSGAAPRLIIFAAGRPAYLGHEPDLTEGQILADSFRRKSGLVNTGPEIVIFGDNRDTQDDIEEMLSLCASRGIVTAAVITVNVHIARAMEFARHARKENDALRLAFVPAESLIRKRYARRNRVLRIIDGIPNSEAYRRTAEREQRGLIASKSGTYHRRQESLPKLRLAPPFLSH